MSQRIRNNLLAIARGLDELGCHDKAAQCREAASHFGVECRPKHRDTDIGGVVLWPPTVTPMRADDSSGL